MAIQLRPTYQTQQEGPVKPKLNLFNFETKPVINQSTIPTPIATPKPNVIQSFLDDSKAKPDLVSKRDAVIKMLQNKEDESFIEDTIVNKMQWKQPGTEEVGLIKQIGERIQGAKEQPKPVTEIGRTLQKTGLAGGIIGDITGYLIGKALPQSAKDKITEVAGTEVGQDVIEAMQVGGEQWNKFKQVSPRIASTVENALNTTNISLPTGTVGVGKGVVKAGVKLGGDVVEAIPSPTGVVTRDLPKAFIKRDLKFTPTERAKIQAIGGKTEEDIILEKGLGGKSKEETAQFFDKNANEVYNNVNKQLATTNITTKSDTAREALEDMLEQLTSSKKLERAYADDIEVIKGYLAKEDYTGLELNNIRRAFDKVNTGMYTASGKARSGIENDIDIRIRQQLNDQIEAIAEQAGFSVKELNKELRESLLMKDGLLRSLSQEQKNNFLGLQDLGVAGILTGGEPLSAALVVGAKKGAEALVPSIAQKLYNLNKSKNVPRTNVRRGNTIVANNSTDGGRLIKSSPSVSDNMANEAKKGPKLTIGKSRERVVTKETPKIIKKPSILSEKEKAKLLEGKKKPSILAKEQVKQAVSKLTKENISEVAETIAKNYPGKLETIKKVISDFIKKHGDKYIDKLSELVDEIATKVGAKLNLVGKDGAMKSVGLKNPIVNKQTGETLNQAVDKLRKNGWEEKEIQKFIDATLGKTKKEIYPKGTITTINPTGGLFVKYSPKDRMIAPLAKNIVTLDKTAGKTPDTIVTIYRGAPKNQKSIVGGDFVTTNKDLAKSYGENVIEMKVKMSDVLDDINEPLGEEYIYRPKPNKVIDKTRVISKGDDLINEARNNYKIPKKLYRGISDNIDKSKRTELGFATLGKGLYSTPDKSFAKKYGKVIELDIKDAFPKNPLVIERPFGPAPDALKNWLLNKTGLKRMSDFHKQYGEEYSVFLKSLGYDGVYIGDEVVKY